MRCERDWRKPAPSVTASGKAIADAMLKASSTVTRTTNQMLAELRKAGPEGSKIFGRMAGDLVDFEQAGRKSIDTILDSLEKVDPVVAAMAANAREELASLDKADRFEKTRQSIAALGGDFALLGKEIKKATDAPLENADAAAKRMVEELMRIDPTKAQQIAKALDNASEAINASRLDEFVKKLGSGSKEAQALSKALGDDMKVASLEAEGGIDGISKKILALRPDLKSTVDQWRMEMAEAAKFGEGQYEKALNALREGGPVSKKVADKIKQELVASGKIVEKTFEDMIKPLEQIDPESAAQARKMQANFQMMEDKGKGRVFRNSQCRGGRVDADRHSLCRRARSDSVRYAVDSGSANGTEGSCRRSPNLSNVTTRGIQESIDTTGERTKRFIGIVRSADRPPRRIFGPWRI